MASTAFRVDDEAAIEDEERRTMSSCVRDQHEMALGEGEGLGGETIENHEEKDIFDERTIRLQLVKIRRHYGGCKSSCIAIDCGDRLELRAKTRDLPRSVKTTPGKIMLGRMSVLRKLPRIVGDASRDQRFASDPLVAGDAQIRFFVGMPLIDSSVSCIGFLCLMDNAPRAEFSLNECEELVAAGEVIVAEYEKLGGQGERADMTISTLDDMDPVCDEFAENVEGNVRTPTALVQLT